MKKITSLLLAGVLLLSSCATIVSKRYYPIAINSDPPEAKIIVTDKKGIEVYTGSTPSVLNLKSGGFFSKARYQVKFIKEGYYTKITPITSEMDGWYFGNLLLPAGAFVAVVLGGNGDIISFFEIGI